MSVCLLPDTSPLRWTERDATIGYYASVKDGKRAGFLLGPFETHEQALDCVPIARATAQAIDSRAYFYAFGTCKITSEHDDLPAGALNEIVKNGEEVIACP